MTVLQIFRNWMKGSRSPARVQLLPDYVWISAPAKLAGIRRELDERASDGAAVIALVAHFPELLTELERIVAEYTGPASVRGLSARRLSTEAAGRLPVSESDVLDLVVAERHPLPEMDEEVVRFAEALPCRCRIRHHLSLDDALLQFAGGDSIRTVLERLGATAEEPLEHKLITRSVQRAQQKIASRATGTHEAASAAEWLERNTPQ